MEFTFKMCYFCSTELVNSRCINSECKTKYSTYDGFDIDFFLGDYLFDYHLDEKQKPIKLEVYLKKDIQKIFETNQPFMVDPKNIQASLDKVKKFTLFI